jgi:hypothetical protein
VGFARLLAGDAGLRREIRPALTGLCFLDVGANGRPGTQHLITERASHARTLNNSKHNVTLQRENSNVRSLQSRTTIASLFTLFLAAS